MEKFALFVVPTMVVLICFFGFIEKKEVFTLFIEGAGDGIKICLKIFPTLIGIFLCVGMMRESGFFDFICKFVEIVTKFLNVPSEIVPLICIKPISGSATIGIATDLMNKFGCESRLGLLAATIMSSSETTFYVIALYLNSVKIKKCRNIFIPAILSDLASIITALLIIK